jgi:small subunit ribosomal protein S21
MFLARVLAFLLFSFRTGILTSLFCLIVSTTSLAVKIKVEVGDGEPIESALRRFKREVNKSGHLMELRHRRHFENSQEKKKRKIKEGRMRRKFERIARRRMANMT